MALSQSKMQAISVLKQFDKISSGWIMRKEIAAWSAMILYLGIIAFHTNLILKGTTICIILSIAHLLFVIIITWLFAFFIHNQIGTMVTQFAYQCAYEQCIWKLMYEKNYNLQVLTEPPYATMPQDILAIRAKEEHRMRSVKAWKRIYLLFYIIFNKKIRDKTSMIEREEGVIYDILLIACLGSFILQIMHFYQKGVFSTLFLFAGLFLNLVFPNSQLNHL